MAELTAPIEAAPGFFRRHRRLFVILGAVAGCLVLALVVVLATVLYKASRVFGRPLPDLVPEDAAVYVEAIEFPRSWPDVEAFLEGFSQSRVLRELTANHPGFRKARLDRAAAELPAALARIRDETGVDALQALAGTETALALYLPEETPPAPGIKAAPAPPSFLFCTRLGTRLVRIAALFPRTVASRAAASSGGRIVFDGSGPIPAFTLPAGSWPPSVHFAVLADVLLVSDRPELLERALALAGSDLPMGLSSVPLYREATQAASAALPPGAFRFWADFDRFDRYTKIRDRADLKIPLYPYNFAAQYLNELQHGVVDLQACHAAAGRIFVDPTGRLEVEGLLLDGSGAPAGPSAEFRPATLFGADSGPPGALTWVSVQQSFPEFWDRLGRGGSDRERGIYDRIMTSYGDAIRRILPDLGPDVAILFRSHPDAVRMSSEPPLPWAAAVLRCRDPGTVSLLLREILMAELEKLVKNMKDDPPPFLTPPRRIGEAEVTFIEDIPPGVKSPICADFAPGFATWRDRIILFTTQGYLNDILAVLSGGGQALKDVEPLATCKERFLPGANVHLFLDPARIAEAVSQPAYRQGIASLMVPTDQQRWVEIRESLERRHGALPPDELDRLMRAEMATIQGEQARVAAELPRSAAALRLLRAFGLSAVYLNGADGRRAGLHARATVLLEFGK